MRRKRKGHRNARRRLAAAMLSASLLLSACGGKAPDPVELMVIHGWGSTEADHVAMRQIYSDFQKDNPDISLKLVSMPTNEEMIRKVEDMLMVGELPDVVFLGGTGRDSIYRFMVENQRALDLMPYLKEDAAFCESIAPINLEYWTTVDGKLYTISDVLQLSGGYWYNEESLSRRESRSFHRRGRSFWRYVKGCLSGQSRRRTESFPFSFRRKGICILRII